MLTQAVGSELWLSAARTVHFQSRKVAVAQTPRESCLAHPAGAREYQKFVAMESLIKLPHEGLHLWIRLLRHQATSQQPVRLLLRPPDCFFLQVTFVELQLFDVPARVRALHEKSFCHICLQFFRLHEV